MAKSKLENMFPGEEIKYKGNNWKCILREDNPVHYLKLRVTLARRGKKKGEVIYELGYEKDNYGKTRVKQSTWDPHICDGIIYQKYNRLLMLDNLRQMIGKTDFKNSLPKYVRAEGAR